MADTGHVAIRGFKAGAIKYVVLRGYKSAPPPNACVTTRGYGTANTHLRALRGFSSNPSGGGGTGSSFCIFGGSILTGTPGDGFL